MTLKCYFESLDKTAPHVRFRKRVIEKCGLSTDKTFYNWIEGKTKPNKKHRQILSELTGIPEKKLFAKHKKPGKP